MVCRIIAAISKKHQWNNYTYTYLIVTESSFSTKTCPASPFKRRHIDGVLILKMQNDTMNLSIFEMITYLLTYSNIE